MSAQTDLHSEHELIAAIVIQYKEERRFAVLTLSTDVEYTVSLSSDRRCEQYEQKLGARDQYVRLYEAYSSYHIPPGSTGVQPSARQSGSIVLAIHSNFRQLIDMAAVTSQVSLGMHHYLPYRWGLETVVASARAHY